MAQIYVGLSGFSYKPWQGPGRFYPEELKQREFLTYYATRYRAVEMDGTWYRFPSDETVASWLDKTPDAFKFCPKAHRSITHLKRLKPECYESAEFMRKRLEPISNAGKLGPVLLQLPPNLKRDDERLDGFLAATPEISWAVEFRNDSWKCAEVEEILRTHSAAWVAADTDEADAHRRDTGNYHYARLRKSEYDDEKLKEWAEYLLSTGKDCYVFLKHEDEGAPWLWADKLVEWIVDPSLTSSDPAGTSRVHP